MGGSVILRALVLCAATGLAACGADDASSNAASTGGSAGGGAAGTTGVGGSAGVASGGTAGVSGCDVANYADDALKNGEKLFSGVTLKTSTPMADILAAPANYEGQVVRVEGFIVTICQEQGCYVTLRSPEADQLNLKVVDGVLDFRQHAVVGQYAIGEGVSQQAGEHGAQIFIQDHGGVIGPSVCALYAGN